MLFKQYWLIQALSDKHFLDPIRSALYNISILFASGSGVLGIFSTRNLGKRNLGKRNLGKRNPGKRKRDNERRGVLICGAYGHGNAGDDAILEAIVLEMREIDPSMPVTVLSRRPDEEAARFGINALHTFDFFGFLREMRRTKLYISGGGSLIQDVTSRRSLWYYLLSIFAAKKLGNKVIMYGCGIGPVTRRYNIGLVRRVLNANVDVITLREEASMSELEQYRVNKPKIILASDPALILPAENGGLLDRKMRELGLEADGKYICFALRQWEGFDNKAGIFAAAADYAHTKYGFIPVFLPIQKKDDIAADIVNESMETPSYILRDTMNSRLAIGILSKMSILISMRLHGLIFAAGQGVPLIAVEYDPKVGAFMRSIKQKLCIEFQNLEKETLCAYIDEAVEITKDKALQAAKTAELLKLERRNVEAVRALIDQG